MPYYVRAVRIDWHYDLATPELQALLRGANRDLSSTNHTAQTFEEALRKLAAERPEVVADALVEDGFRNQLLFRAREGKVSVVHVEERCEGVLDRDVDLPLDELATVTLTGDDEAIRATLAELQDFDGDGEDGEVTLPLYYDDERKMREVIEGVAAVMGDGEQRFVAEVSHDRFLVELKPGKAAVHKLVVVTEAALVGRLLRGEHTEVPEPPIDPDEMCEQALYWPEDMLAAIKEEAVRLDRSLSSTVQRAWALAHAEVSARDREALSALLEPFEGDKRKQTLFCRGGMLIEVKEQAARLDSSMSFVVQSAWALAREAIAALPAQE